MPINESIEYFPLFDPESTGDAPGAFAAIGTGVAAVGTPNALGGAGAVVLYAYSSAKNAWGYIGVLTGSKIEGIQQVRGLGSSCVAVGDALIVGAQGDASTPGRVFVLSPPYGAWSYTAIPVIAELARREPVKGDTFGASVSHCSDGTDDYVAVGAPSSAPPPGVSGAGQVFIFRGLEASNSPWSTTPITNPNAAGSATDRFGASVAISTPDQADGTLTLAVGAPGANEGQGTVYYGRTAERGTWASMQFGEPLVPTFPDAGEDVKTSDFGRAIALTGGVTLAVGSPNDPNPGEKIEGTGAVWIYNFQDGSFVSDGAGAALFGAAADAKFGTSVAFSRGSSAGPAHLVVGAPGANRAYRYVNPGDGKPLTQDAEYASFVGKDGDRFGTSVAASSNESGVWCVVGSPGVPSAGQDGGGFLFVDGDPAPKWMDAPALIAEPPVRWGGLNPDWWKKWTPQIPKYLG